MEYKLCLIFYFCLESHIQYYTTTEIKIQPKYVILNKAAFHIRGVDTGE